MKEAEIDLEALIRRFKIGKDHVRALDVRLSQPERLAILAALRVALQVERSG